MIDNLLLLTGNDIPFPQASISIHQPTLNEISYLNELPFFSGCGVLTISKDKINSEGKIDLNTLTNFDILMSIMTDTENPSAKKQSVEAQMVLSLVFPMYQIHIQRNSIILIKPGEKEIHTIDSQNFDDFSEIIKEMFCLSSKANGGDDYNPQTEKAKEIAAKLRKGRAIAAQAKGESSSRSSSVFSRYASIVAIGLQLNINDVNNYTVYQLFDQMDRLELKISSDFYIKAKMAGAKDLKEVDNWMKDIHS